MTVESPRFLSCPALVYGTTEVEARNKAVVLSLRVIADRLEAGDPVPFDRDAFFAAE